MTPDLRTTPAYAYGLNEAYHQAALHLHRIGRHEDAQLFDRFASEALRDAKQVEPA
jgi:hypothetical protein